MILAEETDQVRLARLMKSRSDLEQQQDGVRKKLKLQEQHLIHIQIEINEIDEKIKEISQSLS